LQGDKTSSFLRRYQIGPFVVWSGLILLVATASVLAWGGAEDAPPDGFTGMITDSVCGARHVKNPNMDAANCTRECVRTGAKYTLIDGEKSYFLQGDYAELAQFAGQRARITGSLRGETIHVSAVDSI
jgi:hypothetical protein